MHVSWGIPVIVSILLLGFVGLEQSVAGQGSSFQQDQIDEIQEIITNMQDQLENLHVTWVNVTEKPVGFENDTNDGSIGIFQSSDSIDDEPCNTGDIVSWSGIKWECLTVSILSIFWEDIQGKPVVLGDLECTTDQIAKWNDIQGWICAEDLSGTSSNTEFDVNLGSGTVTEELEVLYEFKIVDLPSSNDDYYIPINLMRLESELNVVTGKEFIIRLQYFIQGDYIKQLTIAAYESEINYKTTNHVIENRDLIQIESETTEKRFRIIAEALNSGDPATGNFNNLKLKLNLSLPDGASIVQILPPPSADLAVFNEIDELALCDHVGDGTTVCTFIVSVTNNGPDEATGVKIFDFLSTGVIFSASTENGTFEFEDNESLWSIGVIPLGGTMTLTINAVSSEEEPSFTNTAEIDSLDQVDPDPSNDSVEVTKDLIP